MSKFKFRQRWSQFIIAAFAMASTSASVASASPSGTMGPQNTQNPVSKTALNAAFVSNGKTINLSAYRGRPVMVWQVATWCGSCQAGLRMFLQNHSMIDQSDIQVVVLRDYKNGGYPGIGITQFAQQVAPALLHDPHFIFGDDSENLYQLYNPQHYVDIYELIDPDGQVNVVSSAPSATFEKISDFILETSKP